MPNSVRSVMTAFPSPIKVKPSNCIGSGDLFRLAMVKDGVRG